MSRKISLESLRDNACSHKIKTLEIHDDCTTSPRHNENLNFNLYLKKSRFILLCIAARKIQAKFNKNIVIFIKQTPTNTKSSISYTYWLQWMYSQVQYQRFTAMICNSKDQKKVLHKKKGKSQTRNIMCKNVPAKSQIWLFSICKDEKTQTHLQISYLA